MLLVDDDRPEREGSTENAWASIGRGDELLHKPYDARTLVRRLREKLVDA